MHLPILVIIIIVQAATHRVVIWRHAPRTPATIAAEVVVPSAAKWPLRGVFVETGSCPTLAHPPCSISRQQLLSTETHGLLRVLLLAHDTPNRLQSDHLPAESRTGRWCSTAAPLSLLLPAHGE